jgi:hypothetical protein
MGSETDAAGPNSEVSCIVFPNASSAINILARELNDPRDRVIRSSSAIKTWLPLSLAAGAITFLLISVLTTIPAERAIVGSALTAILVFSGMFFRSFGKEKDRYDQ